MVSTDILQMALYIIILLLLAVPLGLYMARVFDGKRTFLDPVLKPLEALTYRLARTDPTHEMGWKEYALVVLVFNVLGFVAVFLIELLQGILPLNPQHFGAVDLYVAFNTAISFATNQIGRRTAVRLP